MAPTATKQDHARKAEARVARDRIAAASAVLLDWDGCAAISDRLQPAAAALLRRHAGRIAIVSNNSTHLPQDFAAILDAHGVPLPPERIVLAGARALERTRARGFHAVMALADGRMKVHARRLGLRIVQSGADAVVLLRDRRFSYAKLQRAANAIAGDAALIVSNPDRTHPGPRGALLPETGALFAAIAACTDLSRADVEVVGKPEPGLFLAACEALGVTPGDAVIIGDNPETDGKGAERLGMGCVLVSPDLPIAALVEAEPRGRRLRSA